MKLISRIVLALFTLIPCLEASPPVNVVERLNGAETALDAGHFVGSYSLEVKTVVSKWDGSSPKTTDMEMRVAVVEGGEEQRRLDRFLVDGEDQTDMNRDELETPSADTGDDSNEGAADDDFLGPFGVDFDRFVFGTAKMNGDHVEMTFAPAPGHENDDGITSGRIAWNDSSEDPLWLEMTVLEHKKPLRELDVRMEFGRVGEDWYLTRMITQGRAKFLLMKRKFRMEMAVRDIVPAQ